MVTWYVRRALPWRVMIGVAGGGAAVVALAHRWEELSGPGLPLVALLAVASVAFAFDEPAVAVTSVSPRGSRWAAGARLGAAVLPLAAGCLLVVSAPGPTDGSDWLLVLGGSGGAVLLLALLASRRQAARPGALLAAVVVIAGLAPTVVAMLFDLRSPYPVPELDEGLRAFWSAAAAVGLLGCLAVLRASGVRR